MKAVIDMYQKGQQADSTVYPEDISILKTIKAFIAAVHGEKDQRIPICTLKKLNIILFNRERKNRRTKGIRTAFLDHVKRMQGDIISLDSKLSIIFLFFHLPFSNSIS